MLHGAVSVDITRLPIDPIEGGQLRCNHLVRARVPGALIHLFLFVFFCSNQPTIHSMHACGLDGLTIVLFFFLPFLDFSNSI